MSKNLPKYDFQMFFDLSEDLMCIANLDGYFEEVNHSFIKLLGYSKEELIETAFINLIHPNDIENTNNALIDLSDGVSIQEFRNRYRQKNGQYLTLQWTSKLDKQSNKIFASARDITKQANIFNRLNQIEKALGKETIIAETNKEGVITFVNEKFCEISGYSKQELIGQSHRIINSGFHPATFFTQLWETISSGEVWSGVIKNKRKNGEFYYVQTVISPIMDHEGKIKSYLSIRQDITKSVKDGSELTRTLKILNETSSIAKVGGWELDVKTGELTWTNETFNILEVEKLDSQKPMLPEGLQLFVEESQPIIEKAVSQAIEKGKPYNLEIKARTAKGKELWVYTNGKPNYKDGEIVSLSGTIQDIDARKNAEIKYTTERQKSIVASKLASLGELSASMAHEINNPLGVISGYAELSLKSQIIDESLRTKQEVILKSCKRISHIVGNLKKFSRTEVEDQQSKQSISNIINESILLANPRLKRECVDIEFKSISTSKIMCNDIEIEQVFLNLINNSIDAVRELNNKWIKIKINNLKDSLEIFVEDSGCGLTDTQKEKLFTPFYTTKKAGEGTGLGLSIIKGILEDHHATIDYIENLQHTSFKLTFPIIKQENSC